MRLAEYIFFVVVVVVLLLSEVFAQFVGEVDGGVDEDSPVFWVLFAEVGGVEAAHGAADEGVRAVVAVEQGLDLLCRLCRAVVEGRGDAGQGPFRKVGGRLLGFFGEGGAVPAV